MDRDDIVLREPPIERDLETADGPDFGQVDACRILAGKDQGQAAALRIE